MRPFLAALVVATLAGCGTGDDEPVRTATAEPGGWTRLPDPPLSPRSGSVAAWTGAEVVVVGGNDALCPPNADCAVTEPSFADGAAYDPDTRTWRPIASAPVGVGGAEAVVAGGDVYLLEGAELLRYRPADDAWDRLPGPPVRGWYALAAAGDGLVAYSPSDEGDRVPDWRFEPVDGWTELPDDPLPPSFDRRVVVDGDALLLFGKAVGAGDQPPIRGARLHPTSGTWTEIAPAPSSGYQAWLLDGVVVVNPHFDGAGGGLFDLATGAWAPLPDPPVDDAAGVLGRDAAVFEYPAGWVFDLPARRWLQVPPVDDAFRSTVTAVGRRLFLYGGERWDEAGGDGEALGDAWLWEPPVRPR